MSKKLSRRDFLKLAGTTSAGLVLSACGVKATELPTATFSPPTATLTSTFTPKPTNTTTPTQTPGPPSLRELADKIGFQVGTEITGWWYTDPTYQQIY